jgi:hypothetical protein
MVGNVTHASSCSFRLEEARQPDPATGARDGELTTPAPDDATRPLAAPTAHAHPAAPASALFKRIEL